MSLLKPDVLHLGVAFDQNYITPFYVLLTSIFEHENTRRIIAHAITTGVSYDEKEKLKSFANANDAEIVFYEIADERSDIIKTFNRKNFPPASYFRIFLPLIVSSAIKKLVYLDTDIIAINSLSELYDIDIGDFPVGAVPENTEPRPDLGICEAGIYFNSGVLLINVDLWKRQHISEKTFQFIMGNFKKLQWIDQDALNVVLMNNYYALPGSFNVTHLNIPKDLPSKKFTAFLMNKSLIHFTTVNKPWITLCKHKFRHLYHYYRKKSPRKFEKKYIDFSFKASVITELLKLRIKEMLLNYPRLNNFIFKNKELYFPIDKKKENPGS